MKRCGECRSTEISMKNAKGKIFPYKDKKIPLTLDYDVRTCDKCDNIILSNKNIYELDDMLAELYKTEV